MSGEWRWESVVAWDELDLMGILHHARFLVHVERAFSAMLEAMGYPYRADVSEDGDRRHAVVAVDVTFRMPVDQPGPVEVVLRVGRCGRSSLTMGWEVRRRDGEVAASGTRTVVHVGADNAALPWSETFRERLGEVMS